MQLLKEAVPFVVRDQLRSLQNSYRTWQLRATFSRKTKALAAQRKVIYALTPPPELSNVGDQAQAVAIHRWFARHFPGIPVLEVNKNETIACQDLLRQAATPEDLIFLHSGGNLGDRGRWSETGRRLTIRNFPDLRIISLPQTISFNTTQDGRRERQRSQEIYAQHPELTVIGRDPVSGRLAAELFPKAATLCIPDFVLDLCADPPKSKEKNQQPPRVLVVLRHDNESILTPAQHERLAKSLPYSVTFFDTTISEPIPPDRRDVILGRTLQLFADHDTIVTDRYHGLIFGVICKKPTVVLRTVDHKLTSALQWFEQVPFVSFAEDLNAVPGQLEQGVRITDRTVPDWRQLYFDRLPAMLNLAPPWNGVAGRATSRLADV